MGGGVGVTKRKVFTSAGTWTVPSGVSSIRVLLVGGGGAGGSALDSQYNSCMLDSFGFTTYCNLAWARAGSGGGSGQIVDSIIDVTGVSSLLVVIGMGGTPNVGQSSWATVGKSGGTGGNTYIGTPGTSTYRIAYGGDGGDRYMPFPDNSITSGGSGFAGGGGAASNWFTDDAFYEINMPGIPNFIPQTGWGGVSTVGAHGSAGINVANYTTGISYISQGSGGGGYYGRPADNDNVFWNPATSKVVELKGSGAGGIGYWGRGGRGGEGSLLPFAGTIANNRYAGYCAEGMGYGAGGAGGYVQDTPANQAKSGSKQYISPGKGAGGGGGFIPDDLPVGTNTSAVYTCNDMFNGDMSGTNGKQGIAIIEWVQ